MNPNPHRSCPDDEVLQELAAGISSPELTEQTMQHVARCSICGPALQRYVREFSAEETPENRRILAQLESSKTNWQRRLVKKLQGRPRRITWLKMVPAVAGLAVVILAVIEGPVLIADLQVKKAQSQTAAAFAGRRTTEMRLTSVPYSPYKPFPTELGGNGGRELDEMPSELTSASSAANENLKKEKVDPRWLQVQGRALLWSSTSGSLERAEKDFEKARSEGLDTPSLKIDLAVSYFERDSRADHPNLQRSLNLLNEVLSKPKLSTEDRASALYNLAIAYEKTQAWDLAVATWEKYLQVDPSSGWANEARQHLKDGKAKISIGPQHSYSDPSFFLQQMAEGSLRPEDPEQYQQKALSQWLPIAVKDSGSTEYRALRGLADIFAAEHQDFWWRDFLNGLAPSDLLAAQALSDAIQNNDAGRYGVAEKHAIRAADLFAQRKNTPGELRAKFEEVYAHRRFLNGADCIARADPLAKRLSTTNYQWLIARVTLDRADCRNLSGELAESDANLEESRKLAEEFQFPVLILQDAGISAGMKRLRGDCDASWKEAVAGLELYWKLLHFRSERLFQFYAVMLQCSLENDSLPVSEALIHHLIAMRQDQTANFQRDTTIEGLLHLHLANILLAQKKDETARTEREIALRLLDRQDEPSANKYRLVNEIEPAEFQLQQGDAGLALATLKPAVELLPHSQDRFFKFRCQQLLGDIYLKAGEYDESVAKYRLAIDTAEVSLETISSQPERLAWLRATDASYRGLVRALLALKKDREALDQWEWYQGRPFFQELQVGGGSTLQPLGRPKRNAIRANVPVASTELRVTYASFKDGLQIWVTKGQSFYSRWVRVDQQDLEDLARDFIRKCATESSSLKDLQLEGSKLYSLLIQPIVSDIGDSQPITVELDRHIYNLPLEALQGPDGQYLGEKYNVVYSLGIRLDGALHAAQSLSEEDSLLLLDATHSPKAGYLPGMQEERRAVEEAFPHTSVVDAANANWNNVRRSLASRVILHYMGHGRPDGTGTSLLFNGTQALRARDFTPELFRRSQLVVVAACSGGKGEDGLLDTDNLVHAFLSAGVPRVIASQWNVDAQSTSQIMQAFYHGLSREKTVAGALFDARNQVLRKAPHPYYWAGFSLTGRAN